MNTLIENLFTQAEGRYLTADEIQGINSYIASVPQRVEAMQSLERAEAAILDGTLKEIWEKHPDFERQHAYAKDKCRRDIGLVLRYAALAMLRDEPSFLTDKLLYWMRTIVQSFEFGEVIDTTYKSLIRQAKTHLDPRAFPLLSPHLVNAHKILTLKQD